jgi:hypothetical protein
MTQLKVRKTIHNTTHNISQLGQCHLFDDIANDSLTVTIDDLWNLVIAGKSGKMVIRILNKLEASKTKLRDFNSLVSEVRSLRKVAKKEARAERAQVREAEHKARAVEEEKLKELRSLMQQGQDSSPSNAYNNAKRSGRPKTDFGAALPSLPDDTPKQKFPALSNTARSSNNMPSAQNNWNTAR